MIDEWYREGKGNKGAQRTDTSYTQNVRRFYRFLQHRDTRIYFQSAATCVLWEELAFYVRVAISVVFSQLWALNTFGMYGRQNWISAVFITEYSLRHIFPFSYLSSLSWVQSLFIVNRSQLQNHQNPGNGNRIKGSQFSVRSNFAAYVFD